MTGSGDFSDPIDRKDRDKIVKYVHKFINNNKMKGFIIDFSEFINITPTEKKNETKQNLFIYSITMF